MKMKRELLLPGLAGALALLLLAEWVLPGSSATALRRPPAIPDAAKAAAGGAEMTQWANTILARPLLSSTRRPAPVQDASVDTSLPRLSAIIVMGSTRAAIFAAQGQKGQLVGEGGTVGVYQVKTVSPDAVELLGPDGPVTLRPQFGTPGGTVEEKPPAPVAHAKPAIGPAATTPPGPARDPEDD